MVSLQIISKVLATKDYSIIESNLLSKDDFIGYESEVEFIEQHYKKYGNVPDEATFLSNFPDIELVEVSESDKYLVNTLREEVLYHKSVPIIQRTAELLKTDANAAAEYVVSEWSALPTTYSLGGLDIIADAKERLEQFRDRKVNQDAWFFTSGFPELDNVIHGLQRGEELIVLYARINQGKSWVLEKMVTHVWQLGYNVGYMSPEMSANSIGYRFDTLYKSFSNKGLMWGKGDIADTEYEQYIEKLSEHKNKFIVATPADFDRRITVTKLKQWVKQYNLDMIAIDGITYLTDERYKRGDNNTTSLTNISEDLMELSIELSIPILIVVQANRQGVIAEGEEMPELETIRDSDGIGANASKAIAIRQTKDGKLVLKVTKQRFGRVGDKLAYQWNIDSGDFSYIADGDDSNYQAENHERRNSNRLKHNNAEVF